MATIIVEQSRACGAGPPARSRRPRRLPRELSNVEEPDRGAGADQGIRPTKFQLEQRCSRAASEASSSARLLSSCDA